jgi:subtilisin family serine protease
MILAWGATSTAQGQDLFYKQSGQAAFTMSLDTLAQPAFVPDDPYFAKDTPSPGQAGQWHLVNQHVAGRDARVQGAWNMGYTGAGVIIGIVDDGMEITHPDLAPNYTALHSYDFGQNDADPSHVTTTDRHGTSVAGVAAAKGGNGIGVTGAAPNAQLAGLRIDFPNQTDQMFVDATLYHSSGGNTSIDIKNHSYGISSPYINNVNQSAALDTSTAAGTIHVIAAGNERGTSGQDANKKDLQNNPNAITVAAMGSNGLFASYSNFGSNVFVTAPSSSSGFFGITTTDRSGTNGYNGHPDAAYTNVFGGTSSATPLVAGVLALVKEAQPELDTRFAKHLLARTSDIVDAGDVSYASDGGWKTNGAGFTFNQNYGFGLIDATELVQQSLLYSGVTDLTTYASGLMNVNSAIPDGNLTGITRSHSVSIPDYQPLEEVLVTLNASHTWRGDLEAILTSPMGTTSRLMVQSGSDNGDDIAWTYTTNAFWGEDPNGQWSLRIYDVFGEDPGIWQSWAMDLRMGTLVLAIPEPTSLGMVLVGIVMMRRRRD